MPQQKIHAGQIRTGVTEGDILVIDVGDKLPAIDASALTNIVVGDTITMLDTPVVLFNGTTPPTAATPLTSAQLTGKSKAVLKCKAIAEIDAAGAAGEQTEVIGQVASSSTITSDHRVAFASIVKQATGSANLWAYDTNEITVNLDGSSQIWYNVLNAISTNGNVWFEIWLTGWHE